MTNLAPKINKRISLRKISKRLEFPSINVLILKDNM